VLILSAPSSAPSRVNLKLSLCHKPIILLGLYGGDDGARTRDLCRDSEPENWNLLKQYATDGPF
jgi:hypothetical protein